MRSRLTIVPVAGLVAVLTGCSGGSAPVSAASQASSSLAAGLKAENAGNLTQARTLFEHVVALQPDNVYAHFDLGVIAQQQQQTVLALSDYGTALTIEPTFAPALYNEAVIFAPTYPQLAMTLYRSVLKVKPSDAGTALNLGLLEAADGQRKAAAHDLQQAVTEDPSLASRIPAKTATHAGLPTPSTSP